MYDLLLRYNVHIVGEKSVPINHCLLANKGVKKEDLRRVLSHPQALAQTDEYLRNMSVVREAVDDTAGATSLMCVCLVKRRRWCILVFKAPHLSRVIVGIGQARPRMSVCYLVLRLARGSSAGGRFGVVRHIIGQFPVADVLSKVQEPLRWLRSSNQKRWEQLQVDELQSCMA